MHSLIDLDFSTDDLSIQNFDLQLAEGIEATRQRLQSKLRLWRGEWFLDTRAGVPWLTDVLGTKSPRAEIVRAAIKRPLLDDPAVDSVESLDLEFNGETRELNVTARIILTTGEEVEINAQPGV